MRTAIVVIVLALAACSGDTGERNETAPAVENSATNEAQAADSTASRIVGRWSLDGKCAADLLTISSDGTWKGNVDSGRWQVQGENLVITGKSSSDDGEPQEALRSGTITSLTNEKMTLTYNGEPEEWLRCD